MKVNGRDVGSGSMEDMLTAMSKASGGIPDFAKKILTEKSGMTPEQIEKADKAGKRNRDA